MWRRVRVGASCLHDSPAPLLCSVHYSPGSKGGDLGRYFQGRQVTEQLGEHLLPLPSGQCLGWAWPGKPAESLETDTDPAAG